MMRILVDTNIVLDVLVNRQPFVQESARLWQLVDEGVFDGAIASFSVPTIHYICQRHAGGAAADQAVDICLQAFEVSALYRECIVAARRIPGGDFEDSLQAACAITDFMQGIVTRNPRDFAHAPIRVYTPTELLDVLRR
jgi:predicted nucleic acid-binding protein